MSIQIKRYGVHFVTAYFKEFMNYITASDDPVKPDNTNEIRFHGKMDEFKKYLPELYEKMVMEKTKDMIDKMTKGTDQK